MLVCLLSMRQTWQLGFKSFRISLSFSGTQKKLKLDSGSTVAFRMSANAMGSERLLSGSSKPVPLVVYKRKGKKSNAMVCDEPNSSKSLVKDDGVESSLDPHSIKNNLARIEAMTFQELRATLKKFGLPAKGSKADLMSALKSHVTEKIDGEVSGEVEEIISSSTADHLSVTKSGRKSDKSGAQSIKTVSEFSSKRIRQSMVDEEITVDANRVVSKQKLSIETDKQTGKKKSRFKTKSSSDVLIEEIEVSTKVNLSVDQAEPWTILAHKRPQKHWIPYNPRTMRPPALSAGRKSIKLISWNVNGLRALLKMEGFSALELAKREEFDVLCLQETKLKEKDVDAIKNCLIDGYDNSFWSCSVSKLGYSGTAIVSRIKPLSVKYGLGVPDHDSEGRLVTAEFDTFYLLSGYVPNSGEGLRRLPYRISQWDPSLGNYIKELEKSKPVILTGDLNCAHQEIDIYDPAGNKRSAGFTIEERQSFEASFLSKGMVDTFRRQHPDVVGYTYWGFRHGGRKTNKGWRLDYFLVSESIADRVHDSYILPDIVGSDHCPIGLILKV